MNIALAIRSLHPTASFRLVDDEFSSLEWLSPGIPTPDETVVAAEATRLQAEYDAQDYARKRAKEYPPITDYIDGVVKGDQAQIDAYIAACQAVKNKYPKPE